MKKLSEKKHWTKKDKEQIRSLLVHRENKIEKSKLPLSAEIPLTPIVHIAYERSYSTIYVDLEKYYDGNEKVPTFADLLKSIKYDGYGVVKFLFEDYLGGCIYEYGNYVCDGQDDYVWLNGSLNGFA